MSFCACCTEGVHDSGATNMVCFHPATPSQLHLICISALVPALTLQHGGDRLHPIHEDRFMSRVLSTGLWACIVLTTDTQLQTQRLRVGMFDVLLRCGLPVPYIIARQLLSYSLYNLCNTFMCCWSCWQALTAASLLCLPDRGPLWCYQTLLRVGLIASTLCRFVAGGLVQHCWCGLVRAGLTPMPACSLHGITA